MNPFEMVFGIIVVVSIARVLTAFARRKPPTEDREMEQRLRRLDGLEERVRVLEKIVTDHRYDLKRQLDELERTP
jgi:hypothetical protein